MNKGNGKIREWQPAANGGPPAHETVPEAPAVPPPPFCHACAFRRPREQVDSRIATALQVVFLVLLFAMLAMTHRTVTALSEATGLLAADRTAREEAERQAAEKDRILELSRTRAIRVQADLIAAQEASKRLSAENLRIAQQINRSLTKEE